MTAGLQGSCTYSYSNSQMNIIYIYILMKDWSKIMNFFNLTVEYHINLLEYIK